MADGQVLIEITAENKGAKQVIRETTQELNNAGKEWEGAGDKFLGIFKKIATSAIVAKVGKALVDLGKRSIEAASDLAEVQNVVDVTFGSASKSIDAWAKNAINQFGLTETQAKQFTSTLGAMMKSSGVAGDDIVKMSTDLAGLAADMASFYNLDFETAFQKIRSGISGETEPLKQLGINMSVANLEAYALTQGITKSFDAMSQGEKTMLRYQYIMQATSDAQGDFARTSDGFANAQRELESNLDSLETKLGGPVMNVFNRVLSAANKLVSTIFPEDTSRHTILDSFADIDAEKERKLAEVQATAETAKELVDLLKGLEEQGYTSNIVSDFAQDANELKPGSATAWGSLLTAMQGINGLENIWTGDVTTIQGLADAMANTNINGNRAAAWQTILDALKNNVDVIAGLRGENPEDTFRWIETLANYANTLDPASAEGWDTLFGWIAQGIPGLEDSEEGRKLLEMLKGPQNQVTKASDEAVQVMEMLGISTEEVNDQQSLWLSTCRELVKLIPSLSSIIDVETGKIKGGAKAVEEYIDAWQADSVRQIYIEALQQKINELQAAMLATRSNITVARTMLSARAGEQMNLFAPMGAGGTPTGPKGRMETQTAIGYIEKYAREAFEAGYGVEDIRSAIDNQRSFATDKPAASAMNFLAGFAAESDAVKEDINGLVQAVWDEYEATTIIPQAIEELTADIDKATKEGITSAEELANTYGTIEDGAQGAANATAELTDEQKQLWETALNAVDDAAKAVDEYREKTVEATRQSLKSWGGMFDRIQTAEEKIRNEYQGEDIETEINLKISTGEIKSAGNMLANLEQRARYLADYAAKMEQAREMGYNADVLANLADGSFESYENLVALTADGANVDAINNAFASVQSAEVTLADTLAGYQLDADSAFQDLTQTLTDSMNTLDSMVATDAPALAIGSTIDAVLNTIYSKYAALQSAVSSVSSMLGMLTETNIGFHGMTIGGGHGGFSMAWGYNGSHADGLDYVPFDGYIGQLHRGEAVLTAQEAQVWREFRNGIDANSLAGAIWDNSPDMGGNVYLNGESVGRIMSAAQADSYRQLERSGWRG